MCDEAVGGNLLTVRQARRNRSTQGFQGPCGSFDREACDCVCLDAQFMPVVKDSMSSAGFNPLMNPSALVPGLQQPTGLI